MLRVAIGSNPLRPTSGSWAVRRLAYPSTIISEVVLMKECYDDRSSVYSC